RRGAGRSGVSRRRGACAVRRHDGRTARQRAGVRELARDCRNSPAGVAVMAPAAAERNDDDVAAIARALLGAPADTIEPVRRGRNSRVFRVAAGRDVFALKRFPPPGPDGRDRLAAEVDALHMMHAWGIDDVARVMAVDRERHCVLLTWLD